MDMTPDALHPCLDLLRQEFVLVQAWKKTSNYIRYHNWYADTLDLDWTTINLPESSPRSQKVSKFPTNGRASRFVWFQRQRANVGISQAQALGSRRRKCGSIGLAYVRLHM